MHALCANLFFNYTVRGTPASTASNAPAAGDTLTLLAARSFSVTMTFAYAQGRRGTRPGPSQVGQTIGLCRLSCSLDSARHDTQSDGLSYKLLGNTGTRTWMSTPSPGRE